jgi:hypothetical protein
MSRLADAFHALTVALWAGALWGIGLIAVPTAFDLLPDARLAAALSARLLLYVALLGLGCAVYLLLFRLARFGGHALRQPFFWVLLVLALLTLLGQFGVAAALEMVRSQPVVHDLVAAVLRDRGASWHGVPSLLYLVQCALAVVLVLLQQSAPS